MSPENEAFLKQLVEHKRFASFEAALDAAVRFYRDEYEKAVEELRGKVQEGLDAADRGESRPLDIEDVKRRGLERWQAKRRRAEAG